MDIQWTWFTIAAALIIIEVISPTFFFIWPGIAAACVGIIALFVATSFTAKLATFAILTVVFAAAWQVYSRKYPTKSEDPALNNRATQLIGQTGVVIEAIKNGKGRVRIGDGAWIAQGPDCPEQTTVKVEGAKSTILQVRP